MRIFIGLDLGTSAVKAVAVDEPGDMIASASASYPTTSPRAGWAEQDPAAWFRATRAALRDLAPQLPADARPSALALSGQLPTLTLLDDAGCAPRPAIVWYDGRADNEAAIMLHTLGKEDWYRRGGVVLDAHYLAPMYAWLARHEPAALRGNHHLCSAKDALLHALTGAWLTDPSTASGYGVYTPAAGCWDSDLCRAAGLDPTILPALAAPWMVAGALRDEWREVGFPPNLPVVVGAGDALTGVLGCGAAVPGTMAAITGTSTSMLVTTREPAWDPARRFLLTPHALPGLWGLEMDLMATGSALHWLAGMLGLPSAGDVDALARASPPGARGLVALPYFAGGEQGALWDPDARAAFAGLSPAHGPADLARALLEGIAFEMRRCLLAWAEAGIQIQEVVLAGAGGAGLFARLLAVVLDRPVRIPTPAPASALGAALLAGVGVGAWDAATVMAIARKTPGLTVTAAASESARYDDLYGRHVRVSEALRETKESSAS